MSEKNGPPADEGIDVLPDPNSGKLDYTYVIGGMVLGSLIGWGLDFLFSIGWMVFAMAPLGAVGGYFLARHHRRHRSQDESQEQ
ncbi:hypothetical protein [Arthrobacter cryoconiti]|uniref:Uncharacterized protein n=1 Tax=Arthrobacter cryoconiti TaxID=748907 RepID=A0ABV8QWW7_9MICC|nr:hypothetical protein [Arthrobacter cryoconiti]MCC9068932.1 hypothetical protein [Arthrobacter cryoconiti]